MQYKQARRTLLEIATDKRTSAKVKVAIIELLMRLDPLPRLGPYKKRSPEQALWRIASDSEGRPSERWAAVRTLLAARVKEQWRTEAAQPPASENAPCRTLMFADRTDIRTSISLDVPLT